MRTSRLLSLAAVSMLVLACERAPTQVQTPVSAPRPALLQNTWFPIQSDYYTCSGQLLSFVGKGHFTFDESFDPETGKYQYRNHLNMQGTATGADGSEYVVKNNSMQVTNDPPTPGAEYTYKFQVKLTGKGPAANEVFQLVYHVAFNANGEPTAYVEKYTSKCD